MAVPSQFPKLRGEGQPAQAQDNIWGTLTPIAVALNATPIMGASPPAWQAFALQSGATATTAQRAPAFFKDALGYVWSAGSFTAPGAGIAANATLWTYGAGYRPAWPVHVPVKGNGATVQFFTINPSGVTSIDIIVAAGGFTDFYFAFLAEN